MKGQSMCSNYLSILTSSENDIANILSMLYKKYWAIKRFVVSTKYFDNIGRAK